MRTRTKDKGVPTKICIVCHRPFSWRRKWARCWQQVRFCSDRCRKMKRRVSQDLAR
ncbi:MAG: DUF2256 domain-containing protein [Planctomycetaceae bacterium]|nr:DUF2256 domain-containing protein [Planctomycetaceae bacterium]